MARKLALSVFLLALLAMGAASQAAASHVVRDGDVGLLYGRPGEANVVSVAYDAGARVYVIEDAAGIVGVGPLGIEGFGCTRRSNTTVACAWQKFTAQLGDRDDKLTVTGGAAPGTVRTSCIGEGLLRVPASPQGVVVSGGPGKDVLIGNAGADCFYGGGSWDDSPGRPEEEVGNDTLVGGGGPDFLVGGFGNDRVDAGTGDDRLAGNDGNDLLDGGPGNDSLEVYSMGSEPDNGSGGKDRMLGGPGNDGIYTLHGRDVVNAGAGNDRVFSLDELWQLRGAATVDCGPGNDYFGPERGDVASGCERIYELWPPHVRLCTSCTFQLEARVGSKFVVLAELRVRLTRKKSYVLIPLGARGRALLQSRGTLQVRVRYGNRGKPLYAREWFVLKR